MANKNKIIVDKIIEMVSSQKMTPEEAGKALAKQASSLEAVCTKTELDHFKTFKKYYYKSAQAEIIRQKYEVDKKAIIVSFDKIDVELQISKPSSTKAERKQLITDAFMAWVEGEVKDG